MKPIEQIFREVCNTVANKITGKTILSFSGGLHSTVLAAILKPMLGNELLAVCVNHGGFRQGELDEITINAHAVGIENLCIIDAQSAFSDIISTTTDGEEKRNLFENFCNEILCCEALDFQARFMVRSRCPGRLSEWGNLLSSKVFQGLYPFQDYSRREVKRLAEFLDLPEKIINRQPSPTPGLFIRVVGIPAITDHLALLKWADDQVTQRLMVSGLYKNISQLVVALTAGRSAIRSGEYAVVVRPMVSSDDFFSARGYRLPGSVWSEIEYSLLANENVIRVIYDGTKKPPASIELE